MPVSYTMTGFDEIVLRMRRLPNVAHESIDKALTAAIEVVKTEVENRCPVETGLLRQNIASSVEHGKATVFFNDGDGPIPQGTTAFLVEVGHNEVTKAGAFVGHVPAHPFLRASLAASQKDAAEAFARSLAGTLPEKL